MTRHLPVTLAVLAVGLLSVSSPRAQELTPGRQVERALDSSDGGTMPYLLYLPEGYDPDGPAVPLMLFLHGRGESNGPLSLVAKWGPPRRLAAGEPMNYVVVSPQCPRESFWSESDQQQRLLELLDHVERTHNVDSDRIYLTGLSMGGYGSWRLAADHPDRFAAVVPVCGKGDPKDASKLVDLPIWAWHGTEDRAVPFDGSAKIVEAIRAAGGTKVRFTSLEHVGHASWQAAYQSTDLYRWFDKQRASQNRPARLRALIIDGQNNHRWQETTPLLRATLENSGRFAVDVATSPGRKEEIGAFAPAFGDYDVVVSNYNGQLWPEATRDAFADYVRGGGGFVSVHAADNAFPNWRDYNLMIGVGGWGRRNERSGPYVRWRDGEIVRDTGPGRGGSHGRRHEFALDVRDPGHPITKGLPARFLHCQDELYDRLRGPAENLTVLATAFSAQATGGSGEHEPLLMAIDFGKGRCFHTALGHDGTAMKCVAFQVTLVRGAEWAATGKVTTPVPATFPGADAVVVRDPLAPAGRATTGK